MGTFGRVWPKWGCRWLPAGRRARWAGRRNSGMRRRAPVAGRRGTVAGRHRRGPASSRGQVSVSPEGSGDAAHGELCVAGGVRWRRNLSGRHQCSGQRRRKTGRRRGGNNPRKGGASRALGGGASRTVGRNQKCPNVISINRRAEVGDVLCRSRASYRQIHYRLAGDFVVKLPCHGRKDQSPDRG